MGSLTGLLYACLALSLGCGSADGGSGDLGPGDDGGPLTDATSGDGGETDPGFDVGSTCSPGASISI